MAIVDASDTMTYHQSRVLTTKRDMSETPIAFVAEKMKNYVGNTGDKYACPETQALWFYGMNHVVSLIGQRFHPHEPLPEFEQGMMERYHSEMGPRAVRAFYYLMWITTREARHNKSLSQNAAKMTELFGPEITKFFTEAGGGEAGIAQKLLEKPPAARLGKYTECLVWQFYNSSWSGGFGGPAWGAVSDCLHRFVIGEYSAEMMLDTIWTLSHNNGPIFNKGQWYGMYNPHAILRILDVQRSGQVPEAVLTDEMISKYADPALKMILEKTAARYEGAIGPWVDWYVVKALGAVGHYQADMAKQIKAHGVSPKAAEAEKAAQMAQLAAIKAAEQKAAEHAKNWYQVDHNSQVKIIHRKAA